MSSRAALLQLAGLIGVEARYTDALGQTRELSDDALLALTAAFGLPSDPLHARHQIEEQQRSLPLGLEAAHLVHAEEQRPEVLLRLPPGCRRILWNCRLADGEARSGEVALGIDSNVEPFAMPLPSGLPLGYHRLEVEADGANAHADLIVAPERCYLPAALGPGSRSWGLSCQLYGLRSERNWGIGDFTDLATLAGIAGHCNASRALPSREPTILMAQLACADARPPIAAGWRLCSRVSRSRRVLSVSAMASRPAACGRVAGWLGSRAVDWTLSGPGGRRQSEWGRSLGRSGAGRTGSIDRCAARRAEPEWTELGLGAGQSLGASASGICAVYCVAARQYAPCRDFVDRSCDVAQPALLDSERNGGESGRLRKLSLQGFDPAGRARELLPGLRRCRRRSRHCARWVSGLHAFGQHIVVPNFRF